MEEDDMMLPPEDENMNANPQDTAISVDINTEEYEEDDVVITYEGAIRRTIGPKKRQSCRKTIF